MAAAMHYINQNASCINCIYQESALKKELDAVRQCKKCMRKNGRPGWDPKPTVKLEFSQGTDYRGKSFIVRRVIS
ncbi:hypothetical protein SAMN04488502_11572 [Dendrosporobacter quercicolus]|uniref:Uncharacterized protein n=1 Tax=Dendrosporobacter quercicolus TaxID=146817 RepID=A0A1G9ZWJ5_9FIRM|nr:hypothetical protein SAMN04488502_11572 [Dendrosporobacter quercicolus]